MKHSRVIYTLGIIGLAALILLMSFTSPTEIGPLGVLLFFTTLYLVLFSSASLLVYAFMRVAFRRNQFRGKDYLYAAVLAFGPVMLLMARSFGAISLWTIILIVLFLALAEFLVYKRI